MEPRARLYRSTFLLAAVYNVAWGAWVGLFPRSFFELFRMAPPQYPSIWQCLGMVIALYGGMYFRAAIRPELAKPLIAIGLAGKLLGPAGWLAATDLPARAFPVIVFNDLIWWAPFTLFLVEGTKLGERLRGLAPYACAALNALAALALFALKGGTEVEQEPSARAAFIAGHPQLWRAGWGLWMAAAVSLICFYAWWGSSARRPYLLPVWVAVAGLVCDLLAESLYMGWLPEDLETMQRAGSILTGGAANGLYSVAGALLTLATPMSRFDKAWAWAIWLSGFALTATTLAGFVPGMVATSAGLMALFCPWVWFVGPKLP